MKPTTLTEAAKRVGDVLGLTNSKRLGAALAAALVEEVQRSPSFVDRVRRLYADNAAVTGPATKREPQPRMPKTALVDLVPIRHVPGFEFNPAAPMDPYLLHEAFGAHQLQTILEALPLAKLKESAAKVERRNPGTRPINRSQKTAFIEYITKYVGAE
jgi:hypothetical protein